MDTAYSSNRLRTNATTVVDKSGAGQSSSASSYRTASPNPFAAPDYQPQQGRELEQQNDERLEGLSQKVRLLKDITLGIGEEVRDSSRFLEGMNDTFGSTQGYLGGTLRRLKLMSRRQSGQWFYWVIFFIIISIIFFLRWIHIF